MDFDRQLRSLIRQAEHERDELERKIAGLRAILNEEAGSRPARAAKAQTKGSKRSKRYGTKKLVVDLMADGRERRIAEIAEETGKTRFAVQPVVRGLLDENKLVQTFPRGPYRAATAASNGHRAVESSGSTEIEDDPPSYGGPPSLLAGQDSRES